MISAVAYRYITSNPDILHGEPIIKDTRTPVRAIVELYRLGISAEEIPTHLPHLRLAQIFDALEYYSENTEEIHRYIAANRVSENTIDALAKKS